MAVDIAGSCGDFTASLWEGVEDVFKLIIDHPFNRAMAEGSLSRENFRQYLEQDILYLKEDNRALSIMAERAVLPEEGDFFRILAGEGMAQEEALHRQMADSFEIKGSALKSRACLEYGDFLVSTALDCPYEEAAAALLPCYWVYQNAGRITAAGAVKSNPYQAWLDTYGGDQFSHYTEEYIRLVEKIARRSKRIVQERMTAAFRRSTEFELDFLPLCRP